MISMRRIRKTIGVERVAMMDGVATALEMTRVAMMDGVATALETMKSVLHAREIACKSTTHALTKMARSLNRRMTAALRRPLY